MKYTPKQLATGAVKNVASNFLPETEQSRARLRICSLCEPHNKAGRCNLCGCPVAKKVKFLHEFCPIGKW